MITYMVIHLILSLTRTPKHGLMSAKLDATGQRLLAALGSYDFTLTYRCGKKVQVGKDQEKAQSEKDPTPKTEVGKNQTNNQVLIP